MDRKRKLIAGTLSVAALAGAGVGASQALGGQEKESGAKGPGADRAKAAALDLVPGGTANAVERDSERGATWEVEVRKPDGSTVDVRLGADFQKVSIDADSEDGNAAE